MTYAVEDLVNQALDAIGYAGHIADIYEGSPAARVALEIYSLTRDALLQDGDWPFAMREVALVDTGFTPPTPWATEYAYPTDCLRVRYVRPGPLSGGTLDFDPQPVLFRPYNDVSQTPAVRTILCSLNPAVLIYNGKVTDPASWEPGFTAALVAALAKKMTIMLPLDADVSKGVIGMAAQAQAEAETVDDLSAPRGGVVVNGQQR